MSNSITGIQGVVLYAMTQFHAGARASEIAGLVGRQPGHERNGQHTALILRELRALEKAGHVIRGHSGQGLLWFRVKT